MSVIELLSQVPLFRHLPKEDLDRVARATRKESFGPEEPIVEIGDPGRCLYIVVKGTVQVLYPARSADFELARLGPGDFFGEMALLNEKPRSATVRTVEHVEVLVLDKEDFHSLIVDCPPVALRVMEAISKRIRNADEQISGLSDRAVRDPLTGLLNRRAFGERMGEELDRARRYGDVFTLVLLDLDRFGMVNETIGHDAGDEILTWVGRVLRELTRAADIPFRVGGEEFAVICPATNGASAGVVAHRLVEVVAEATPTLSRKVSVTVSAGYACCPEHGHSYDGLYAVADQALLRAKSAGRNRVGHPEPDSRGV